MSETLTSLILAAGVGRRIRGLTDRPKVLLKLRGETLLQRHLRIHKSLGIDQMIIVVGFQRERIFHEVAKCSVKPKVSFVESKDFQAKGNSDSLLLGLEKISGATILFDGDLFYEMAILRRFLSAPKFNAVLIGTGEMNDIEATKVLIDARGILRKFVDKRALTQAELQQYHFAGEAMGVLRFDSQNTKSLRQCLRAFLKNPQNAPLNWEHPLNDFLKINAMHAHFESSNQWMEIDDATDYAQAMTRFEKFEK